jgi:hypothetical protein
MMIVTMTMIIGKIRWRARRRSFSLVLLDDSYFGKLLPVQQ